MKPKQRPKKSYYKLKSEYNNRVDNIEIAKSTLADLENEHNHETKRAFGLCNGEVLDLGNLTRMIRRISRMGI